MPFGVPRPLSGHHELLPEPLRVFPGELAGEGVQGAESLHSHEEGLVRVQPHLHELRDLLPKVVFQLLHIHRVDRLAALEIASPLVDLRVQRSIETVRRHIRQAPVGCGPAMERQIPRSVASTVCHCRRSSASCSCPAGVIP